ncbi:MAG: NADPH:quinone oxidoreductase family protein [Deltaproteobacteria bacterium]
MRAVMCKEFGPPEKLVVEEIEAPVPGPGQVKLGIRAASVNFPDALIIQDKYQFKAPPPFIPGAEFSGEVTELGEGVEGIKVGDRVVTVSAFGGFAEETVVEPERLIPIPDSVSYEVAAASTMVYGTSYYALKQRAALQPGETLLVLGAAGGVGLAAVELGRLMGARVIAAASNDDKLELCRQYGADEGINYSTENLKERTKELTDGAGANVIYDPVGGDFFDQAIRCIAWEGRLLVIGFASGRIPELPANLALLKGCQVVGVFWGAFTMREPDVNIQNMIDLGNWFEEGKLKPHISRTYGLDEAPEALRDMLDRKVKGKIVVTPGS